jgi:NAD(P)-dependent dehydrogenase (short-subunit alcohol dehydrogenase family)
VLVNNAGVSGTVDATICHETTVEEWDRVLAINTRGPFLCARAALPVMLAQGSGHIITVASVAGQVAFPGRCAYTASKGAALMFAKSLAADYAAAGIRSNAVCPGFVRTPMTQWRLDVPELREQVEARIPTGRVAEPDDIADAIAVLASGRLGYMMGAALVVDGGWTVL